MLAIVLPPLGFGHRFSHLVIARNWLSAGLSYLFVVVPFSELVFSGGTEGNFTPWLTLIVLALMIWSALRITRAALDTTPIVALAFVVAETLLSFPLAISLYGLAGLYSPA